MTQNGPKNDPKNPPRYLLAEIWKFHPKICPKSPLPPSLFPPPQNQAEHFGVTHRSSGPTPVGFATSPPSPALQNKKTPKTTPKMGQNAHFQYKNHHGYKPGASSSPILARNHPKIHPIITPLNPINPTPPPPKEKETSHNFLPLWLKEPQKSPKFWGEKRGILCTGSEWGFRTPNLQGFVSCIFRVENTKFGV